MRPRLVLPAATLCAAVALLGRPAPPTAAQEKAAEPPTFTPAG